MEKVDGILYVNSALTDNQYELIQLPNLLDL